MFCKNCGKELKGNDKFCINCGCAVTKNSQCGSNLKSKQNIKYFLIAAAIVVCAVTTAVICLNLTDNGDSGYIGGGGKSSSSKAEDKSQFEMLKEYVSENGMVEAYEKLSSDGFEYYSVSYDKEKDAIKLSYFELENIAEADVKSFKYDNIKVMATIYIDENSDYSATSWYYLITESSTYSATANIDKKIFSKSNQTVSDINIDGLTDYRHYDITKGLFTNDLLSMLKKTDELLKENKTGVTLYGLGYVNFK